MKKYFTITVLLLHFLQAGAQHLKIIAFPITGYIIDGGDSISIVQIKLPPGFTIKEKTYGLIRSIFEKAGDSVITVGSGRCRLIKGEYYYYGLLKKYMPRKPIAGDLLYTDVSTPDFYYGNLFDAIRHNITINSIQGDLIATLSTVTRLKTEEDELLLLTKLQEDVKFTGKVMAEENNNQNMMITNGRFKDQKLFTAMQAVTVADVKNFLGYINSRPEKYAGHSWKFSEIMATWMAAGAPL